MDGEGFDAALSTPERTRRIHEVVADFMRRCDDGERISSEQIVASFPNLMPDLQNALDKAAVVRRARLRAGSQDVLKPGSPGSSNVNADETLVWRSGSSGAGPTGPVALDAGQELAAERRGRSGVRRVEPEKPAPRVLPEVEGYAIVDQIGRGGMGVVYEAYQEATGRRVALKYMLNAEAADEADLRRFEREIDLIARLSHPNIISILDSGLHRDRYYYVMDFVDGAPLDRALPAGRSDVRKTLELLAEVCDVVDYAHQRGVLHRDLKPSNVLVDERGRPRLLDFGLAKSFDPQSQQMRQSLSQPGQIIGTLHYMSPEQARGDMSAISVRSDVYSLGAMAYELLTGQLPFRNEGGLRDVLSAIAEKDARRPSLIRKALGADVDAIVLKTLEKNPQRRYATAAELATDIRRYLSDEPIMARRTGIATRLARKVRHNKTVSAITGVSLVSIVVLSAYGLAQITADREDLGVVVGFLENQLGREDPDLARGASDAERRRLLAMSAEIDRYRDQPKVEAKLRHMLGRALLAHGLYDAAIQNLSRAYDLRRSLLGEAKDTADSLHFLGKAQHKLEHYADAEKSYELALELRRRLFGQPHADVAESLSALAEVIKNQNRYDESEKLYRSALAMRQHVFGPENEYVAVTMNDLAQCLFAYGRYDEALDLFEQTLAMRRRLYGEKHRSVADSLGNLGSFLRERGQLAQAEDLLRKATAMRRELLELHPDTVVSMNLLGLVLRERGAYAEAETLYREALDLRQKLERPGHAFIGVSMHNLALVLTDLGKYDEARSLFESALQIWQPNAAQHKRFIADGKDGLANLERATGRLDAAQALAEEALALRRELYVNEPDHPQIGVSQATLGEIQLARGDAAAAEPLLREALRILGAKFVSQSPRVARVRGLLGAALAALNRPDEAEPRLVSSFETLRDVQVPRSKSSREAAQRLVDFYTHASNSDLAATYQRVLDAP